MFLIKTLILTKNVLCPLRHDFCPLSHVFKLLWINSHFCTTSYKLSQIISKSAYSPQSTTSALCEFFNHCQIIIILIKCRANKIKPNLRIILKDPLKTSAEMKRLSRTKKLQNMSEEEKEVYKTVECHRISMYTLYVLYIIMYYNY